MTKIEEDRSQFEYEGFSSPNGTIVPDDVFDKLMPHLSDIELRVLLYIIRRTFGFKKDSDTISLSQVVTGITTQDGRVLDQGAGVSKPSAIKAVRLLEAKKIIVTRSNTSPERGFEATTYALRFRGTPLSTGFTRGSQPGLQGLVNPVDIQQTGLQETVRQQTDLISNSFDRFANLQKLQTRSVFSKERDKLAQTHEGQLEERGRQSSRGDKGEMTAIGHIISRRKTVTPEHAPVRPKTAPESAANPGADSEPQNSSYNAPERPRRGRPPKLPPYLEDLVDRYSADLHDDDHVAQNRGQAARLWKASGYSEAAFGQVLSEAKAITLERDIRKRAKVGGEFGWRNKMPYLFTVLRDLLGMKEAGEDTG